jgi:phage baseplate assembly protein W
MSWDLALSEHGDLIFAANRDLAGISGIDLIEQRMRIRMVVHRGSWVYDTDQTLGSNLRRLIGMSPEQAASTAPALVREALRAMDEITVDDVNVQATDRDITLIVLYKLRISPNALGGPTQEQRQLAITLPIVAGGV